MLSRTPNSPESNVSPLREERCLQGMSMSPVANTYMAEEWAVGRRASGRMQTDGRWHYLLSLLINAAGQRGLRSCVCTVHTVLHI